MHDLVYSVWPNKALTSTELKHHVIDAVDIHDNHLHACLRNRAFVTMITKLWCVAKFVDILVHKKTSLIPDLHPVIPTIEVLIDETTQTAQLILYTVFTMGHLHTISTSAHHVQGYVGFILHHQVMQTW